MNDTEFCRWVIEAFDGKTRSPIEREMGLAMAARFRDACFDVRPPYDHCLKQIPLIPAISEVTPLCATRIVWIVPQFRIENYTADFMVLVVESLDGVHRTSSGEVEPYRHELVKLPRIVVECDGHDFHERTKEQAQHDKERDRIFATAGFRTLRFTGSEIHRDSKKCADSVIDLAYTLSTEHEQRTIENLSSATC